MKPKKKAEIELMLGLYSLILSWPADRCLDDLS